MGEEEWMTSSWELMERAKEELEILQTHHPNRFEYLKSELESFISLLRDNHAPPPPFSSDAVLTQASSNCKKKKRRRKEKCGNEGSSMGKNNNINTMAQRVMAKRKDRVDMVLERAQLCLQKIRDVKSSLS